MAFVKAPDSSSEPSLSVSPIERVTPVMFGSIVTFEIRYGLPSRAVTSIVVTGASPLQTVSAFALRLLSLSTASAAGVGSTVIVTEKGVPRQSSLRRSPPSSVPFGPQV